MELTKNQKNVLLHIREEEAIPEDGCTIHKNTMNSLYEKGLMKLPLYANGEFWELTDLGLAETDKISSYVYSKKR